MRITLRGSLQPDEAEMRLCTGTGSTEERRNNQSFGENSQST